MKRNEIRVGQTYRNDSGTVRRVLAEGEQFSQFARQQDQDCVAYCFVQKQGRRTPECRPDCRHYATRRAFARWARAAVP